jgi:hypothetical protein
MHFQSVFHTFQEPICPAHTSLTVLPEKCLDI